VASGVPHIPYKVTSTVGGPTPGSRVTVKVCAQPPGVLHVTCIAGGTVVGVAVRVLVRVGVTVGVFVGVFVLVRVGVTVGVLV
jgi:hypothetical protein